MFLSIGLLFRKSCMEKLCKINSTFDNDKYSNVGKFIMGIEKHESLFLR